MAIYFNSILRAQLFNARLCQDFIYSFIQLVNPHKIIHYPYKRFLLFFCKVTQSCICKHVLSLIEFAKSFKAIFAKPVQPLSQIVHLAFKKKHQ